ncbi:MAG: RsmE family RNA methyltransferase [Patescibacteria group bacterium]
MTERFFINEKIQDSQDEIVISDIDLIHQVSRVLRKKAGDIVIVLDNSGFEFKCEIRQIVKNFLLLKILNKEKNNNEPSIILSLYQSLVKKDKMELIFEKCTEIGVSKFYPIISEHSVKLFLKVDRARKILKEATEQSQRGVVPKLADILKFKEAIMGCKGDSLNIIFYEKEKLEKITDFLIDNKERLGNIREINIFIGPEGGFSEEEIGIAREKGFILLSLGGRILRAETAAIIASAFFVLER